MALGIGENAFFCRSWEKSENEAVNSSWIKDKYASYLVWGFGSVREQNFMINQPVSWVLCH